MGYLTYYVFFTKALMGRFYRTPELLREISYPAWYYDDQTLLNYSLDPLIYDKLIQGPFCPCFGVALYVNYSVWGVYIMRVCLFLGLALHGFTCHSGHFGGAWD